MKKKLKYAPFAVLFLSLVFCSLEKHTQKKNGDYRIPEGALIIRGIEQGVRGGRLVCALTSDPKTFNPMLVSTIPTSNVSDLMFKGLTIFDKYSQTVQPGLAQSWDKDGRNWIFHLRKGVRWSDGHTITADDVLFSFEVLYDSIIHPPSVDFLLIGGKRIEVEKIDSLTVKMLLPSDYGPFINMAGSVPILPRHKLEDLYRRGEFEHAWGVDAPPGEIVVSGPFFLYQYEPNEKVVLRRNPYFWQFDESGTRLPYLDEIVYTIAEDENAVLLAFKSGKTHMIQNGFPPNSYYYLKEGERDGDYTVYDLGPRLGSTHMWFNMNPGLNERTGKPFVEPYKLNWFRNVRFRRAIAHAIDRPSIVRTVLNGMGTEVWGPVSPNNSFWFNEDLARYPFDLEKASGLLEDEGFEDVDGDGILEDGEGNEAEFTLFTNSENTVRIGMCNIIAHDLAEIGIRVHFVPIDFNDLITRMRETYDYEAILVAHTEGIPPDPVMQMSLFLSSGDAHLWYPKQEEPATRWEAEIDSLMLFQIVTDNQQARKNAFDRVQRIMNEQVPLIFIVNRRECVAARNILRNIRPSILEPYLLHNAEQIFMRTP